MAVVVADVRALSLRGEFDDLKDEQIQPRIDLAEGLTNRDVWDRAADGGIDRGDDGVKYLAAHYLAIDMRSTTAPAGPVMSESAGGMSRGYGFAVRGTKVGLSESLLMRTIYGQRYLELRRSLPLTPLAANTAGGGSYSAS